MGTSTGTCRAKLRTFLAATIVLTVGFAFAGAVSAFDGTPKLAIPIPTIKFTEFESYVGGTAYDIPWIAEYVAGLYRYSLNLGGVIATVMIVIGGFQYLTAGGDASRVKAGKQRITDAVIGLFLLVGSYVILNTINPDLVTLSSLRILTQKKQIMAQDQNTLNTTKTPTAEAPVGAEAGAGTPAAGAFKPTFPNCPFELTETSTMGSTGVLKDPRRNAFIEKAKPFITGSTPERLQKAGELALKCGIHFGSCGATAGAIYAIAGVGDPSCLTKSAKGCHNHEKSKIVKGIPSSAPLRKVLCSHKEKCCTQYKVCNIDNSGCVENRGAAMQKVAADLSAKYPGWPDAWADEIKPGDILWVYNGNSDCGGQHSAMVVGWATGGRVQVIQGQWGKNPWMGTICVRKSCGASQQPITQIFRAP